MRAENSHRHNRRERFRDDKSDTGQCGLQISVERAAAFRENENAVSRAQKANERLERAAIAAFLIDRDDIQLRQKPAEKFSFEETFAREIIDVAFAGGTGKRRIEIALVVHRHDDRAFFDQMFLMQHAKAKEQTRDQLAQRINRPVIGIHSLGDLHPFLFQLADDLADNAVDGEVRAIDHMRIFRDDER